MGKMNRIVEPLSNGDRGRDCEVEDWCGSPAYQLSATDKPIGQTLTHIQPIIRTIRYKCANGHRFDKQFRLNIDLFTNKATDSRNSGGVRANTKPLRKLAPSNSQKGKDWAEGTSEGIETA